eukprot:2468183-Rhodomonas_salina.1
MKFLGNPIWTFGFKTLFHDVRCDQNANRRRSTKVKVAESWWVPGARGTLAPGNPGRIYPGTPRVPGTRVPGVP